MQVLDIIGSVAGVITTLAYVPQIITIIKNKSAHDISYATYISLYVGILLWTYYAFLMQAMPMILANVTCLTFMTIILYLKYKYTINNLKDG